MKSVSSDNIERSMDKEAGPGLWMNFASLIHSDELPLSFCKPWFAEVWLLKNVPKEAWPPTTKRVRVFRDDAATPSQPLANVVVPELTIEQQQRTRNTTDPGKTLGPVFVQEHYARDTTVPGANPDATTGQEKQAQDTTGPGNDLSAKRKRDEDADDDSSAEYSNKTQKAEAEASYFTMGSLAFRPQA